jgi:hypothetical protein
MMTLSASHTTAWLMVEEEQGDQMLKVANNGTLIRFRQV